MSWSIIWCLFRVTRVHSGPGGHRNKRQVGGGGQGDIWPYGQTPAVHRDSMRHLVIYMNEHEQNTRHYLHSYSWHPRRLMLCGQAKYTFAEEEGLPCTYGLQFDSQRLCATPSTETSLYDTIYIFKLHTTTWQVPPSTKGFHKRSFH